MRARMPLKGGTGPERGEVPCLCNWDVQRCIQPFQRPIVLFLSGPDTAGKRQNQKEVEMIKDDNILAWIASSQKSTTPLAIAPGAHSDQHKRPPHVVLPASDWAPVQCTCLLQSMARLLIRSETLSSPSVCE